MNLYLTEINGGLDEKDFNYLLSFACRPEQILLQKKRQKAECMLIGRLLPLLAVRRDFHIPINKSDFAVTDKGKPYLNGIDDIFFSISHSENTVVCAVCNVPVGVDIQKITYKEKIANRFFSDIERKEISQASSRQDAFTQIWTRREAYGKLTGNGIFEKAYIPHSYETVKYKDFFITVAYAKGRSF